MFLHACICIPDDAQSTWHARFRWRLFIFSSTCVNKHTLTTAEKHRHSLGLTSMHLPIQVTDFGLCRVSKGKYVESKIYGKLTHMSPEVIIEGHVSKASDAYSFGVMLWEMYTGLTPWDNMRPTAIIRAVTDGRQLEFPSDTPDKYKVCLLPIAKLATTLNLQA